MMRRQTVMTGGALLLLLLLFTFPMIANRGPVLYPDTVGYYQAGHAALGAIGPKRHAAGSREATAHVAPSKASESVSPNVADGVSTSRSAYYGVIYVLMQRIGGSAMMALLQIASLIGCLWLAARHLLSGDVFPRFSIIAITGLVGGASFVGTVVLPDIFSGLMILAIGLYIQYAQRMSRAEQAWWLCIVIGAIMFHKSNMAIAIVMVAAMAIFRGWLGQIRWRPLLTVTMVVLAGSMAVLMVNPVIRVMLKTEPIETPFLLARVIGDHTGEAYLRATCPQKHYVTCRFLPNMPMTENDFLWSRDPHHGVLGLVDAHEKQLISHEQTSIVIGTILTHGGEQAVATIDNFARQLATVGVQEYGLAPTIAPQSAPGLTTELVAYRTSPVATGRAPLKFVSSLMTFAFFGAAAGLLFLAVGPWRREPGGPFHFATAIMVFGVVVNAAVCGVLSGVFDRYEGRVSWILTFLFAVAIANTIDARRVAPQSR